MPKIKSLHENFMNFETDVCIVTETWLQTDNNQINELLEDFQNKTEISNLCKDRRFQRGEELPSCMIVLKSTCVQ